MYAPQSAFMAPPATMGASVGAAAPQTMMPSSMPMQGAGPPMMSSAAPVVAPAPGPITMQGQYMPNVSRPVMVGPANPPVVAGNIQYGPSYKMQYQKRSTADKTAVKYTGFLPLEGVYEEDTCRIG